MTKKTASSVPVSSTLVSAAPAPSTPAPSASAPALSFFDLARGDYQNQAWYQVLNQAEQTLAQTSLELLEIFNPQTSEHHFIDYSFIIFPIAKSYEGFLKSYLLKKNLIDQETFSSKRWRIGRALNPDVSQAQKDELWFFDELEQEMGEDKARQIWNTWLESRNHVFHYFPDSGLNLFATYEQAQNKVGAVIKAVKFLADDLLS